MKKCGTCKFFHNGCEFSKADSVDNNLINFVACAQYEEYKPSVGDTVYHIDSGDSLRLFRVTKVNKDSFEVESNDLNCKAEALHENAPWPRLFYNREAAEIQLQRFNMEKH